MKNKVDRKLAKTWLGKSLIMVGQHVDEVWMGIGQLLVKNWSAFKAKEVGQKLDESWTDFGSKRLLQLFSNTSPENEGFSLDKSGQHQDEIGIENCVKVSSWFRQFGGFKVGQLLGETCVDLGPFYPAMNRVIQPPSFIAHSLIVHNKRVSYGYTKVTPALHQEFSLFDISRVSLYVVLPDQSL
ncbi:hypothetical protein HGB07_02475 [Candidatus Roizmanbacteria bacterium]|nr:hypothetical protein [Candidatus Roizmanbacteria bacterium]